MHNSIFLPVGLKSRSQRAPAPAGQLFLASHVPQISARSALVFCFDLLAAALAWWGSFMLHFNFALPPAYDDKLWLTTGLLLLAHGLACSSAGLYRGIWVFASLPDLKRVIKAVSVSTLAVWLLIGFTVLPPHLPVALGILYPMQLLLIMGGSRAIGRMWKEYRVYGDLLAAGKPVVVIGAGTGGALLVRELERSPDWRVVALVDDDHGKWGREIYGKRVAGSINSLPQVLKEHKAQHVILAMPSAANNTLKAATDIAIGAGAQVFTLPGLEDLMGGKVAINAVRPLHIEDLLGREPVRIDSDNVAAMSSARTVLITGAGGSIGSELCRQLLRFAPLRLVLVDNCEFALYNIEQWFADHQAAVEIIPIIGDIRDQARMETVFTRWQPELVFHAAAYKHVPLMEVDNAWEAVLNNAFGTLLVASCAQRHGAERFVLISTDKAVNPTNVMGASKRLAEMICEALHCAPGNRTQMEMVRFGNVLGSTGSVIPKFAAQIARGGPVTVTHPEITRYFMSIPEAAQLVLQAAAMGEGGEIFVLDMGEPVKILDLARNMIRLSGLDSSQIGIEFVGLRPGEKLYEELLADSEETRDTPHPRLRIARSRPVDASLIDELSAWFASPGTPSDDEVRAALQRWVSEYQPARH